MKTLCRLTIVGTLIGGILSLLGGTSRAQLPASAPAPVYPYGRPAPYPVVSGNVFDRTSWNPQPRRNLHKYYGDMKSGLHPNKNVPPVHTNRGSTGRGFSGFGGFGGARR